LTMFAPYIKVKLYEEANVYGHITLKAPVLVVQPPGPKFDDVCTIYKSKVV